MTKHYDALANGLCEHAEQLLKEKRTEEAFSAVVKATVFNPYNVGALNIHGRLAKDLRKGPTEEIPIYDEVIQSYPDCANAYYCRGVSYRRLGQPERAMVDFNRAIDLDPCHILAYGERACVYDCLGMYEESFTQYTIAEEVKASFPGIKPPYCVGDLIDKGKKAFNAQDYSKAVSIYGEVINHAPDNEEGYVGRARAYQRLQQYEQACMDYQKGYRVMHKSQASPTVFLLVATVISDITTLETQQIVLKVLPLSAEGYRRGMIFINKIRSSKRMREYYIGEKCFVDAELVIGHRKGLKQYCFDPFIWA